VHERHLAAVGINEAIHIRAQRELLFGRVAQRSLSVSPGQAVFELEPKPDPMHSVIVALRRHTDVHAD
jgi:hypothetical protein